MYRKPDKVSQEDQIRRHRADRDEKASPAARCIREWRRTFPQNTRQQRHQNALGHEHRFLRKLDQSSRTFAIRRGDSKTALTIFVDYATTSSYEGEELEAFYIDLGRINREDHTFSMTIVCDFNAKIGPRTSRLARSRFRPVEARPA
ncbi:unnamed protein product [Haemonchus placei]|uniref:Craniofacial development protein 2-like n=1 Tax=Haemonchus placei TaxID=6290 RepID=A0A0N4WTP4_HAEPC|nr:unnamed protein product [Haemonchus placei]